MRVTFLVSFLLNLLFIYLLFDQRNEIFNLQSAAIGNSDVGVSVEKSVDSDTSKLAAELALEREIRIDLEKELSNLQEQLYVSSNSNIETENKKAATSVTQNPKVWFDNNRLIALNLSNDEIEALESRYNRYALKLLELQNSIGRSSSRDRIQIRKDMTNLREKLRQELGDEQYDLMLYGSSQSNRVEVIDILAGSAADSIGLSSGDLIVSYGGEKIFSPTTIYQETRKGDLNEPTELLVQRGQEILTFYVPRGPLGTRFKAVNLPPLIN